MCKHSLYYNKKGACFLDEWLTDFNIVPYLT
jgi:hypothetical protein